MSRELIATRLKEAMGLHSPTVGMVTITNAIDRRMRACDIEDYNQYLLCIKSDEQEMKELIEAVIIPETWFFRETQPYEYLLKHCKGLKNQSNPTPARILSAPCSTGEEPYSIAMTLMDNGFSPDEYKIDAIDIGEKHINRAKKGIYRKYSFRSNELSFVGRYFEQEGDEYRISDRVKQAVSFQCANILDDDFKRGLGIYDVIFCRNLLIYFDASTQHQVFATLDRLLKQNGILILGHAETVQHSEGRFSPAMDAKAYVHIKSSTVKAEPDTRKPQPAKKPTPRTHAPCAPRAFADVTPAASNTSVPQPANSLKELEQAFVLANEGELDKALEICVRHIENESLSSRAHYLAGIIHDSKGNADIADKYLRKAIYLEPNNHEALVHLSLMAEQSGNNDEASRLRGRAQRVQERGAK